SEPACRKAMIDNPASKTRTTIRFNMSVMILSNGGLCGARQPGDARFAFRESQRASALRFRVRRGGRRAEQSACLVRRREYGGTRSESLPAYADGRPALAAWGLAARDTGLALALVWEGRLRFRTRAALGKRTMLQPANDHTAT